MYEGLGFVVYKNGDRYEGEMNRGKRHGKGTMTYRNGMYEGGWKGGASTRSSARRWSTWTSSW